METSQNVHVMLVELVLVACLLAKVENTATKWKGPPPPGHGQPLGSHMRPMGATLIGRFSSPQVFYGHFVKASKPIHMKSAQTDAGHPGPEWTDDYFRDHFGKEMIRVEVGKKESRERRAEWMRFSEFLDLYSVRDLYMVHSITGPLTQLVLVPSTLQCGGFQKSLQEAVMWMGQGTLKSVLHYDELDNLLCVFDGTKDVVLIDQLYKGKVEINGFNEAGHYSDVDPDAVDMNAFPQFTDLPWYRVHLAAGDCVYIPYKWYHQVSSHGNRSLAINIWFSHLWWFDDDSCADIHTSPQLRALKNFGFASPNEATRSRWLEAFSDIDEDVDLRGFIKHTSSGTEERKKQLYTLIDLDNDGYVSWEELYSFNIDQALPLFPDVFGFDSQHSADGTTEAYYKQYEDSAHRPEDPQSSSDAADSGPETTENSVTQHGQDSKSVDHEPETLLERGAAEVVQESRTSERDDDVKQDVMDDEHSHHVHEDL